MQGFLYLYYCSGVGSGSGSGAGGSVSVTGSVTVSVAVSVFVDTSVVSLGCVKDGVVSVAFSFLLKPKLLWWSLKLWSW